MKAKCNLYQWAAVIIIGILFVSGCAEKYTNKNTLSDNANTVSISSREFYVGIVPTPKNFPDSTWNDITNAYQETSKIAEVVMVWVNPSGIGQYEKLNESKVITALRVYGLKPIVTLNFATIKEVPGYGLKYVIDVPEGINASLFNNEFRSMWVKEAKKIAAEFQPEYFSLGNEVNDYFFFHPEEIDVYISLFDEAYKAIKEVSPQTKVFVVFSYEHLIDNAQWDLLAKFNSRADMIGLTTYPWKDFNATEEIPYDYYTTLKQHVSKPLAFTEIGWISSEERGSSEDEQAKFLVKFLELTKDMDIEMINWLFLHEVRLNGIVEQITEPESATISLKKADGTKKAIYDVWVDLYAT